MAVAVAERDQISKIVEADEIKALRAKYREEAEILYCGGNVEVLTDALSLLAERGIYRLDGLNTYIDLQETMNFLREKYDEEVDHEIKEYVEATLEEAREALKIIGKNL
ncbi:MAG: hypothetical protein LBV07_04175 [Syntrophobacterales bacterium]|nr:hypothetical protein [Syntrophobacterales bacterium]